jgi:ABC-type bacteriocin/lantibiotic exporter with double-glycine peptidase domain
VLALFAALLATSLGWATSFFLQTLIDTIVPNQEMRLLVLLGSGLFLVSALQLLLQFGRLWLMARVGRSIHGTYGKRYLSHLMSLPLQVFDGRCVPNLVMRTNQVDTIQYAVSETLVSLFTDGLMFAVALGIILAYDPIAALIAVAAIPLILGGMVLLNDKIYDAQLKAIVHSDDLAGHLVGVFDGIRNIKVFSAEERYKRFLNEKFDELTRARYESRVAMMFPVLWGMFAASIVISGVLWYGGTRILAGQITAGELIVIFGMIIFYLNPVQRFPALLLSLRGAFINMKRLEDILALPAEHTRTIDAKPVAALDGKIEFDRVSFAYKRHHPVLKQISFSIQPGETVAIVGETGSGKSSLANLLAGFYLPVSGDVRIDGVSTRQIAPEQLRQHVSAVFQGPQLFQQSVFDNITMLGDIEPERVEDVAQRANAAPFIEALYKGYQSQVSRGGDNFSAGQAQRIALARALLKDAPILILDEATSNLDGATEQAILQALEQNRHDRTTVVIAHRLSTVMHADRILVLHQGELVEAGTHDELIQRQGQYYQMFGKQSTYAKAPLPQPELIE